MNLEAPTTILHKDPKNGNWTIVDYIILCYGRDNPCRVELFNSQTRVSCQIPASYQPCIYPSTRFNLGGVQERANLWLLVEKLELDISMYLTRAGETRSNGHAFLVSNPLGQEPTPMLSSPAGALHPVCLAFRWLGVSPFFLSHQCSFRVAISAQTDRQTVVSSSIGASASVIVWCLCPWL